MLIAGLFTGSVTPAGAVILWNDPDKILVHDNGAGTDILGGAVKRDDSARDTLYFKFHVDPLSDSDTEEYAAAFELFAGDEERLGIGNALKAWAYSAFFPVEGTGESNEPASYIDLHTLKPESVTGATADSYQYPRRGQGVTIVFKIQYIPGEDDLVTVWLNPDLGPGANEAHQPDGLTTRFNADAKFDEIRLRHTGKGGGWFFSDLAIATSFSDFVDVSGARPKEAASGAFGGESAFTFQTWQKAQGLPQSPVRALTQTHDGYVWIGSNDGLARFDGLRFVTFGNQEGIKCGTVSVLFEDSHDALWIGSTDSGLGRWQNNQFTNFTMSDGLPTNAITALAEDNYGRLWIGTAAGLAWWQNGHQQVSLAAESFKGQNITALFKDRRGRMWVGVKGAGVFEFTNGLMVPLAGDLPAELLKNPHCLLVDHTGRLWIGAGDESVLCHDGDNWHHYRIPRNEARSYASSLAEEADGTVWAGSAGGGLLQFKDGRFVPIPVRSGLAGSLVESLLTDREGKLWVGTDAGLNRLHRKTLYALGQSEGLGYGPAEGLAEVSPGVVWVSKPGDGLYRWDGKSFSRLSAAGLPSHDSQITALLVTDDGFCWVATTNRLLLYKDPVAAADEVEVIGPARPNIISMAEDREGALWMGTRDGKLWKLRAGEWLAQTNFSQSAAITALATSPDGTIWIGTSGNGLYRFDNGIVSHIDKAQGLSSDFIRVLHLDANGILWIGLADEGLSRWQNGRINNFNTHEGLPDNNISQILADDAGRLWLGTSRGIACVSKSRLNELADGQIATVYPQIFGQGEGMLSEECTGGICPSGLKSKSGLLWFPTAKGVVVINPNVLPATTPMPNTVLEEVLVDGVPVPFPNFSNPQAFAQSGLVGMPSQKTATLRIGPGRHRVEFRYTGLSFDAPESIRFRYRLQGLDADWVDAGGRRSAFYSYLPPGSYQFLVGACNRDGAWSNSASALELVVLRYFWQTWWFISLAGISLLAAVGGTVRYVGIKKLQGRLKHLEQQRVLERERTRIAQDLHDEMGAKFCRISFLSEHARGGELSPNELQDQIASISDASREVLHSLDEIVWAVNPQNDTLEHVGSYISQYAMEYFQMTGIECDLDIPIQLPPYPLSSQIRHHLFLATQEAFTNILKHSGATHASVAMKVDHEFFEIKISDNGKGFVPPAAESKFETVASPSGDGLRNMWQRLADIGGQCTIISAPGRGTILRFAISLNLLPKNN